MGYRRKVQGLELVNHAQDFRLNPVECGVSVLVNYNPNL
jgi:hypothetical protein